MRRLCVGIECGADGGGGDEATPKPDAADLIRMRLMDGISRSATVVISAQINAYLTKYLSLAELLLIIGVLHTLLSVSRVALTGFNASISVIKSILKSIVIQSVVAYITDVRQPVRALMNLLMGLVVAECLPPMDDWLGEDIGMIKTSISYIFSDQVSVILMGLGIPLIGASLGLCLRGEGVFGQTMVLTGINVLCSVAFNAISGGDLSLAWPLVLLYFVHEVVRRFDCNFEDAGGFLDYGLYKASDATYSALMGKGVSVDILAIGFTFLSFALKGDEVWTGVCVLILVRAASDWFLGSIALATHADPALGGLCVVTVIHFVSIVIGTAVD